MRSVCWSITGVWSSLKSPVCTSTPERRADDEAARVRDAVRDGEELDLEDAGLDQLAGLHHVQFGVVEQPVLVELDPNQAVSKAGAVDRAP